MKKKVIRLNESDIEKLVKIILKEDDFDWVDSTPQATDLDYLISKLEGSGYKIRVDGGLFDIISRDGNYIIKTIVHHGGVFDYDGELKDLEKYLRRDDRGPGDEVYDFTKLMGHGLIKENDFDWAKDISIEGKEYVLDLLNNTEERCFNDGDCLYRHDRDNTFYIDEKNRQFIYDFGKVSLPLQRKFGIPEDEHDELIKSVVGYKYGDKYNDYKFKVINKGGHWNWRNFLR